jgi:hypothetical protein
MGRDFKNSGSLKITVLALLLSGLIGCASDAPDPNVNLNSNQIPSLTSHPELDATLVSISGNLNSSNEAFVSASGAFGSVISSDHTSYAGSTLRLRLSQGTHSENFDLLISIDSQGEAGFNLDANGAPMPELSFGVIDPNLPIDYTFLYGDVDLLHGQFFAY